MAIDSAAKRRSVVHVGRKWSGVGVTPDATPDQAWRQTAARGWYGILAGAAAAFNQYLQAHGINLGLRIGL